MRQRLKNKIVQMLESLTTVGSVYKYEPDDFQEDPVVTVTGASIEADYRTTTANRRVYYYTLRLWVSQAARTKEEAEQVLGDLEDEVTAMFDKYFTLGRDINGNLSPGDVIAPPTGYMIIRVEAIPSAWYFVDREDGFRMAEVTLRCHVDVDVSLIT